MQTTFKNHCIIAFIGGLFLLLLCIPFAALLGLWVNKTFGIDYPAFMGMACALSLALLAIPVLALMTRYLYVYYKQEINIREAIVLQHQTGEASSPSLADAIQPLLDAGFNVERSGDPLELRMTTIPFAVWWKTEAKPAHAGQKNLGIVLTREDE